MNASLKPILILAAALLPFAAQAHKAFLLPSSTVLADSDHEVTVDAAISNDLFYFNHAPMRLDALTVYAPDGTTVAPENVSTGKFRTTFDVPLGQPGTYKIASVNEGVFAIWDENGTPKRWRGNAERFKSEVPAKAKDLRVTQMSNRVETFVTVGKPSLEVFKPSGSGLELVPVTHPNDLVAGEAASFQLLLDGKPASALKVVAVPGGTRYRDQQDEIETTTGADGRFSITWPAAGMYWLNASLGGRGEGGPEGEQDKPAAKRKPAGKAPQSPARRVSYSAVLEVLP